MCTQLSDCLKGAGLGTCAAGVLSYIKKHHPQLYSNTTYTIIEISEQLAIKQRERLLVHKNATVKNMSVSTH